jgi:hypothetical protein
MTRTHVLDDWAESSALLVQDYDLTGMLVKVIAQSKDGLEAMAGGLLVTNLHGDLELLSATSHRAGDLETYQAISGVGPCVECIERGGAVDYTRAGAADQWPNVGQLMSDAGYGHVLATPLRWRGDMLGGLNLFFEKTPTDLPAARQQAQAYSDILTLFIVNSRPMSSETARERIEAALAGRVVIEQAKGVIAELQGLSASDAYQWLLDEARLTQRSITDLAHQVVEAAQEA